MDYLHTELLIEALDGQDHDLIPDRVQVLVDDFAFVQRLPVQLEFHVGVAGAFKGERERARQLFLKYTRIKVKFSSHTPGAQSVSWRAPRTDLSRADPEGLGGGEQGRREQFGVNDGFVSAVRSGI